LLLFPLAALQLARLAKTFLQKKRQDLPRRINKRTLVEMSSASASANRR
jgi:hypothetical protein